MAPTGGFLQYVVPALARVWCGTSSCEQRMVERRRGVALCKEVVLPILLEVPNTGFFLS